MGGLRESTRNSHHKCIEIKWFVDEGNPLLLQYLFLRLNFSNGGSTYNDRNMCCRGVQLQKLPQIRASRVVLKQEIRENKIRVKGFDFLSCFHPLRRGMNLIPFRLKKYPIHFKDRTIIIDNEDKRSHKRPPFTNPRRNAPTRLEGLAVIHPTNVVERKGLRFKTID